MIAANAMHRRWVSDLAKRDVKPDLILSSPARRALATAEIIAKKLDSKLQHHHGPWKSVVCSRRGDLLDAIRKLGDKSCA